MENQRQLTETLATSRNQLGSEQITEAAIPVHGQSRRSAGSRRGIEGSPGVRELLGMGPKRTVSSDA